MVTKKVTFFAVRGPGSEQSKKGVGEELMDTEKRGTTKKGSAKSVETHASFIFREYILLTKRVFQQKHDTCVSTLYAHIQNLCVPTKTWHNVCTVSHAETKTMYGPKKYGT